MLEKVLTNERKKVKKIMPILLFILCVIALAGFSGKFSLNPLTSEPSMGTAELSSVPFELDIQGKTPLAEQDAKTKSDAPQTVIIQVGNKRFTVILYDNDSTQELRERLPLILNMDELNGIEKFYFFSEKFPTDSKQVGNVKTGDLMLYGSDCLVLFYRSFSTSYNYTRLGYIEDVTGLANALGNGSVEVAFGVGD